MNDEDQPKYTGVRLTTKGEDFLKWAESATEEELRTTDPEEWSKAWDDAHATRQ